MTPAQTQRRHTIAQIIGDERIMPVKKFAHLANQKLVGEIMAEFGYAKQFINRKWVYYLLPPPKPKNKNPKR